VVLSKKRQCYGGEIRDGLSKGAEEIRSADVLHSANRAIADDCPVHIYRSEMAFDDVVG